MKSLILVSVLAAAAVCAAKTKEQPEAKPMAMPKQLVAVEKVQYQTEEDVRRYTGHLVSPSTVLIVPRVSGEIIEVGFEDGAYVKKGQMLYKLDPVQYYSALKACEARISVCEANIAQAKSSIAECKAKQIYAQKNFERNQSLYEKNVVTADTFESVRSAKDSADAATSAAAANLAAAEAALLEAKANLIKAQDDYKNTTIYAPMDALAGVTAKTVGNYVTPSTGTLVSLIQTHPMRARFSIAIQEYLNFLSDNGKITGDPQIRMCLANGKFYEHEGKLELINNEANRTTDTIQVFAKFDNKEGILYHGSTVSMYLRFRAPRKNLAIYPSCVMHDEKSAYVYVVDETGKVSRRNIVLGLATSDWQFIISGLAENEVVIKDGMHKVMPGALVDTTEEDTVNRE